MDFCSLKAGRIGVSQLLGQRNFLGLFRFGLVGCFFFLCVFPVDSKEILLLLGRQNPALTHSQSLSIGWFIRKTGMVHIKMSIFSSCFSILVIIPVWVLYWEENTGQAVFPWFKALHRDCSVTELFLFLTSTCGFPTAVVGLWRAGGKVPQR